MGWLVAALVLTGVGEATAIALGSPSLGLLVIAWYGVVFLLVSLYRIDLAFLLLLVTLPLVTLEVPTPGERTLSGDKLALTAVAAVWAVRRGPRAWPRLREVPAIRWWVALVVVAAASAVANAGILRQALGVVELAVYAALFALALDLFAETPGLRQRAAVIVAVTAAAVAGLALVERGAIAVGVDLPLQLRAASDPSVVTRGATIGHANFLAAYLVLVAPALLIVRSPGRRGRWLVGVGLAAIAVALVGTRSMGGGLGFAVSLLVVLFGARGTPGRRLGMLALVAAVVTVLLTLGWTAGKLRLDSPSFAVRGATHRIGLAALRERPLLGFGAGGFERESSRLEVAVFGRSLDDFHANRGTGLSAHSSVLNVAVQRGLLGLAAFGGILVSVTWLPWRRLRRSPVVDQRVGLLLTIGLVAFVVQAFTENLFSYSKVTAMFWIMAAALTSLPAGSVTSTPAAPPAAGRAR
ncbi:MAG: O-antigen ligase family protein [Candidatus Rokubacteria bacterium]|nr:O-antigen ligase family protein [Candidatus Rokubacteria bacterium]